MRRSSLEDIVLFGSLARGSAHPGDVDMALFVRDAKAVEGIEPELQKLLAPAIVHITIFTIATIFNPLWSILLQEGWSVAKGNYLSALYGISPQVLYAYALKSLTPVQKVQYTRGLHILLKQLAGEKISRTVVMIPLRHSARFEDFLRTWKLEFSTRRYQLVPSRSAQ